MVEPLKNQVWLELILEFYSSETGTYVEAIVDVIDDFNFLLVSSNSFQTSFYSWKLKSPLCSMVANILESVHEATSRILVKSLKGKEKSHIKIA